MTRKERAVVTGLIESLLTCQEDARMALSGDWDKDNAGFQAQIDNIDRELLRLREIGLHKLLPVLQRKVRLGL